jgi:alpha-tubulin suppressor-like RCC1 family protein
MSYRPFQSRRRPGRMPAALAAALLAMFGCQGETTPPTSPETPPALATTGTATLTFRQLSLNNGHTCGVTTDDTAWCWGDGVLGDGTFDQSSTPIAVTGGLHVAQVTSGGPNCLLTTDGQAYCWGFNWEGELGDGTTEPVDLSPVAVAGNRRYTQLHAGFTHACALAASGAAFCWGQNAYGELGTGTSTGPQDCSGVPCSRAPVRAARGHTFVQVKVGSEHTCGLDADHRFWCWGNNEFGQLGDGTTTERHTPSRVTGSRRWETVIAGWRHSCGVTGSGRAFCWGNNEWGQLGDGTKDDHPTPVAVVAPM